MIMFLVLNTSGLTIIPVSIMAYRAKAGAADPTDVFIPLLLTTLCSTIVGLITVSVLQRINLFKRAFLVMFGVIFFSLLTGIFLFIAFVKWDQHWTECASMFIDYLLLPALVCFGCLYFLGAPKSSKAAE